MNDFDPQIAIPLILGLAFGLVLSPLAVVGHIPLSFTLRMAALGVVWLPVSSVLFVLTSGDNFRDVVTLNVEGPIRGVMAAYVFLVAGAFLTAVVLIKTFLKGISNKRNQVDA